MSKQWFPTLETNENRAAAGSLEGKEGRAYLDRVARRMLKESSFLEKVCTELKHKRSDFASVQAGKILRQKVESVLGCGRKTLSKTTMRIHWKDGSQTNFIVKKAGPAHICLKTLGSFFLEFEAQFHTMIPAMVKEALKLFLGQHEKQKDILDSVSVNFVGNRIRDKVERSYHNRLTLASMYGYKDAMADELLQWFRRNSANLFSYCFSICAAKSPEEAADYLWFHTTNAEDSDFELFDLKELAEKLKKLPVEALSPLVGPGDREQIGSTINLPFGNLQYHEGKLEFRHNRKRIIALQKMKVMKTSKNKFGSVPKESGHENEELIAKALNGDKAFREHFCDRVCRKESEFVKAEAGGKHAKKEMGVLGKATQGKTDVSVFWKDGTRTNISVKKRSAGQVYLVTAQNFVNVYEAQYGVMVPSRVCRALAFFVGADPESRAILEATDISIDGIEAREIARRHNYRLAFEVIRNYDPLMAEQFLEFLKTNIAEVFELSFAAGAVKDRGLWSNILWYKNVVDTENMGLDYLVPIPEIKAALLRRPDRVVVAPGPKNAGSTIHLPFGHLEYLNKQLEFFQQMKKIQAIIAPSVE